MTNMQGNGQSGREPNPDHRITIEAARRMIGMIGKNYDDEEITDVLGLLYGIAEEGFESYSREIESADQDD